MSILDRLRQRRNKDPLYEAERLAAPVPTGCPKCCGRIELLTASETWVCRGLVSREEVEKYLIPEYPKKMISELASVTSRPTCGWTGKDADFGKRWL